MLHVGVDLHKRVSQIAVLTTGGCPDAASPGERPRAHPTVF